LKPQPIGDNTEHLQRILSLLEGTYTLRILENFFEILFDVGPYLFISVAINVLAVRFFRGRAILLTTKSELASIFAASLIGLISPLPTYAAIPIGISLVSAGIPFSAVMAFVISSPLMNPSIFFLTATQIGVEMAIARTTAAFVLGIVAGLLTIKFFKSIYKRKDTVENGQQRGERSLLKEISGSSLYVAKYFSVAILLSAAVKATVPPQAITSLLGGNAKVSTLIAIGMGVPFYTCGGAAIPLVKTLMEMGMSKSATLAFFIAGPATKLETLYAYNQLLGGKVLAFYLVLTISFSYVAGLVYSLT
jgi:uncharacterized membrane protein YraQ (UPF0718 family)